MLYNYLKIVFRNLWRYKGYTIINIAGLAIGIAAMVWGYQTYRFSFSFDDFHKDRDNVYRALTYKAGGEKVKGIFPMALLEAAQNDFPGIKATARFNSNGMNVKSPTGEPFSEQVNFTDPSFFDLFNFPIVSGNNDIKDRSGVLITEEIAKKYFGNQDAVGKILIFYAWETYAKPLTIKGVLKNMPANSTIRFDFLTNFDNLLKPDGSKIDGGDWSWLMDAAFFKIPNPADAKRMAKAFDKYLPLQNKAREDWKVSGFKLITLKENAVLIDVIDSNALYPRPDDAATFGPLVLAFLVLLSACLNFSNTTVARANRRLKEIGMRKVMGSTHAQLIKQMLLECAIIVLAAIALSILLNLWWLPAFNKMFVYVDVHADYFHDIKLIIFLVVTLISATLLAGAYPAFYISRFSPSSIFRGNVKFGGSNLFSRLMLGLQLCISIITVIAGISFARNGEFQKTYDFGYRLDNTMGVYINDANTFKALKNELSVNPQIISIAGTRHRIGFEHRKAVAEAEGIKKETNLMEVGKGYISTMNLKTTAGRAFDDNMESDYLNAVLITQKMAAIYGWKDGEALGKQIHIDTVTCSVVGVLKDFHSNSLFEPTEPVAMRLVKEDKFHCLIIQASPANLTTVFESTKLAWKKLFPTKPFNGFYQNEVTAEGYRVTGSIAKIFSWFAIVSILLTATGLFALVSLTVVKKMREIALRKVVGANTRQILILVNKGYFWIFIVAALLGCYGGWALTKLLLDMIFKINAGVQVSTLINSVIVLLIITAVTTGIRVLRAVRTNTVTLLRTE
ncbi:MAG: ABC transporter permease [Ferruginibacter sp.]